MLGLVISDSFKTVVTIYILIPFLVIPQIILSGIIVKFDKLNPDISSPVAIPVYGELITARWGYEALAVRQFIDNRYETGFYKYDKAKSRGNYMKNYWYVDINGRLDDVMIGLSQGNPAKDYNDDLKLVSNEIRKLMEELPDIRFEYLDDLTPERANADVITAAMNHIELLRKYFVAYYNNANDLKDSIINSRQAADRAGFIDLQSRYHNKSLEDFVTAKNDNVKILPYHGRLIQKMDPIFKDPEPRFIRAHFYSPTKNVFGSKVDTYSVNIAVLWLTTLALYLILYFRLLKKLLDSSEEILGRNRRGSS
jgi:ABC transport system ATP-binding/permease protein